jgi:lysozyme family protein
MTPEQVIADYIRAWEGVLSLDPVDNGNWTGGSRGSGVLVGSKYGVTAAALAVHRKVAVSAITKPIMAGVTLEEAAAIGREAYYDKPGLDNLAWNRVTASVLDFGWGSGPRRAIEKLQAMIGAKVDGDPGPKTQAAYKAFLEKNGEEQSALKWCQTRNAYYEAICAARPEQRKYLNGWRNRSAYFAPATNWWRRWGN